jgi:hypothetical protein
MYSIPESVLKKQKTLEELRAKRAERQEATLKARKVARKEAFVRAEKYIKEYSAVSPSMRPNCCPQGGNRVVLSISFGAFVRTCPS